MTAEQWQTVVAYCRLPPHRAAQFLLTHRRPLWSLVTRRRWWADDLIESAKIEFHVVRKEIILSSHLTLAADTPALTSHSCLREYQKRHVCLVCLYDIIIRTCHHIILGYVEPGQ